MKYDLVGVNGNAWSVMGYVGRALKEEGLGDLNKEYMAKDMSSDYNNLLSVSLEYLDKANEVAEQNGYEEDEDDWEEDEDDDLPFDDEDDF